MFSDTLEKIFTPQRLTSTLNLYKNRIKDYDEVLKLIESGKFLKELLKGYIPKPVKSFHIPKNENETREIIIASTSSKIIQKILSQELGEKLKFSDKSYAYRQGKGVAKAINRTKDFLRKYDFVVKVDIDDFFDTINQERLIEEIDTIITDKRILKLIAMFLKNGMLRKNRWIDKHEGVYQGDVFAPLLSNIYLDKFDRYLESCRIDFVRFADDMLFFAKDIDEALKTLDIATKQINLLGLRFEQKKSHIANKIDSFVYLGLRFKNTSVVMDNDRLMRKISNLSQKTKNQNLLNSITVINEHIQGVKNYYAKVLSDFSQFDLLHDHVEKIIINKILEAKKTKFLTRKSSIRQALLKLDSYAHTTQKEKNITVDKMVDEAYRLLALENPLKQAKKETAKNKSTFLKSQIQNSEIVLNRFGLFAGMSMGKVVVKEKGKLIKKIPVNLVTRIMILSKGVSISSALIYECSKRKIDIDFIYHGEPYAMVSFHRNINNELHLKQIHIKNRPKGLALAKEFVKIKTKNQINLIKYYGKYREQVYKDEFTKLQIEIDKMLTIHNKIKHATSTETLMGLEGVIGASYWCSFGLLIEDPEHRRVAKGASDSVNQALNYGYAILYNRVKSALVKAGLNIYTSFLHTNQPNKPTLVFDMVEEFRQPVVDREILSILNKGTKITTAKGRLTEESIKIIVKNIQSRLATPTKSRYGKMQLLDIIDMQANLLKRSINGVERYKGFTAKY